VITWEIDTGAETYRVWVDHVLLGSYTGTVPDFSNTDRWTLGQDWDGILTDFERNALIDRSGYEHGAGV